MFRPVGQLTNTHGSKRSILYCATRKLINVYSMLICVLIKIKVILSVWNWNQHTLINLLACTVLIDGHFCYICSSRKKWCWVSHGELISPDLRSVVGSFALVVIKLAISVVSPLPGFNSAISVGVPVPDTKTWVVLPVSSSVTVVLYGSEL